MRQQIVMLHPQWRLIQFTTDHNYKQSHINNQKVKKLPKNNRLIKIIRETTLSQVVKALKEDNTKLCLPNMQVLMVNMWDISLSWLITEKTCNRYRIGWIWPFLTVILRVYILVHMLHHNTQRIRWLEVMLVIIYRLQIHLLDHRKRASKIIRGINQCINQLIVKIWPGEL